MDRVTNRLTKMPELSLKCPVTDCYYEHCLVSYRCPHFNSCFYSEKCHYSGTTFLIKITPLMDGRLTGTQLVNFLQDTWTECILSVIWRFYCRSSKWESVAWNFFSELGLTLVLNACSICYGEHALVFLPVWYISLWCFFQVSMCCWREGICTCMFLGTIVLTWVVKGWWGYRGCLEVVM